MKALPADDLDEMELGITSHASCLRKRLKSVHTREAVDKMVAEIRIRAGNDGSASG